MSGNGDPIRWTTEEDPVSAAARHAAQSAVNTADRAFQVAYMIQVMRTQRVQDELAHLQGEGPDERYQAPIDAAHAERLNGTVAEGDLVIHGPDNRVGTVSQVADDGTLTINHRAIAGPGEYQVIRRPDDPAWNPEPGAATTATRTDPTPLRGGGENHRVEEGTQVRALDRGNVGLVISVDADTAMVRFTNQQTSATREVSMPLARLEALPPKATSPPPSGLLRADGRPDPERIARTQKATRRNPNRPANRKPKPGPTRHPRPPGT